MKLELWLDLDAVTTPTGVEYPAGRYCEGICPGHMMDCIGYAPFNPPRDLWCRHLVDEQGRMPRVGLCRFSSETSGSSEVETENLGKEDHAKA